MITHDFDAETKTVRIAVTGDIISTNATPLQNAIMTLLQSDAISNSGWTKLALNLNSARMIDSTGLNLLITLIKFAKAHGATISASITSVNIQRTFLFTRMNQQMDIQMIDPSVKA